MVRDHCPGRARKLGYQSLQSEQTPRIAPSFHRSQILSPHLGQSAGVASQVSTVSIGLGPSSPPEAPPNSSSVAFRLTFDTIDRLGKKPLRRLDRYGQGSPLVSISHGLSD